MTSDPVRSDPSVGDSPAMLSRLAALARSRFVRFLTVGVINTLFGYGVYALLILLGTHYTLAALISTVCGVLFNFKTIGLLVFKDKRNSRIWSFVAVYAVTYGMNIGLLKVFLIFGVGPLPAGAILLLPMALVAYTLQRLLVFRTATDAPSARQTH